LDILKLAKRSIFLMSNSFLKLITQIAIIILFAKQLSVYDYGIFQSVWMYVNIISVITLFGLPSLLLSNNLSNVKNWIKANKKRCFFYILVISLSPIAYLFFIDNIIKNEVKVLLVILIILQNISTLIETEAIKKEKEILLFTSNLFFNLFYFTIHIYILYNNYKLENLLLSIIILVFTKTFLQKIILSKSVFTPSITNNNNIANQWFFIGITDVVGIIFKWIDKWAVLLFISLQEFSTYFNGSYEIPIYGLMVSAVGNVMLTEISKNIDKQNALKVFNNSVYILSKIVLPSFCFLLFFYKEIFHFIFSNKYETALPIFFITLFIIPLRITSFTAILQVYNKAHIILKGAVIDLLLAISLMAILYPFLKLTGIALACVISTYFQAFYYLWHSSKTIQQPIKTFINYIDFFKTLFFSIITMGICYYLSNRFFESITLLIGIVVCAMLILIFSFYSYKINKQKSISN
jgi:O-antigen/teichoic acid export membrane protein